MIARLSDEPLTDLMVDIETTGTNPYHTGMIQLAALPFNLKTGAVGQPFNRCLELPANRFWDEGTRRWWGQQKPEILRGILAAAEEPSLVIREFWEFVCRHGQLRFWSRGTFDFWFIQSYMDQYGMPMPFRFNEARDLRSYQAGLFRQDGKEPDLSWVTPPAGDKHNALFDCVYQLKQLFSAQNGIFHEILPPEDQAA